MQRRDFIGRSVAGWAGVALMGCTKDDTPRTGEATIQPGKAGIGLPGVQLYTVLDAMERDARSTLQRVAEVGYREVEFAGYFDLEPATVKGWLEEFGLTAPASHVGYEHWEEDHSRVISLAAAVGHTYVLVPGLPDELRTSLAGYRALAERFNAYGRACADAGIRFGYHNHEYEFTAIDGTIPFDILASETDPDLVDFEIDLFWTIKAGQDPLTYFEKYPGRFRLCHVKDMASDGSMVEVGAGEIDFATLFGAAGKAGLEHFFVEHDEPDDGFESIATSFEALSALLG